MSHYKSNVRDQVFNLFEVFGIDKAFGDGKYTELDRPNQPGGWFAGDNLLSTPLRCGYRAV